MKPLNELISQETSDSLGIEMKRKLQRRSHSPIEVALEIKAASEQGYSLREIAKFLEMSESSSVLRYFKNIGKLPLPNLAKYLSELWSESINDTKRRNKLSLTALGEFAACANSKEKKFNAADITNALEMSIRYSFGKSDMIEARQISKLRSYSHLSDAIEAVHQEKGNYNPSFMGNHSQTLIGYASTNHFSERKLSEIKQAVERVIGPIINNIQKKERLIIVDTVPGKISDGKLLELLPTDAFQSMIDNIIRKDN